MQLPASSRDDARQLTASCGQNGEHGENAASSGSMQLPCSRAQRASMPGAGGQSGLEQAYEHAVAAAAARGGAWISGSPSFSLNQSPSFSGPIVKSLFRKAPLALAAPLL